MTTNARARSRIKTDMDQALRRSANPEDALRKAMDGGKPLAPGVYRLTERGNGRRFADQYRDRIRYCTDLKEWMVWTGKLWQTDSKLASQELAKQTILDLYAEAAATKDKDFAEALREHARRSDKRSGIENMLACARSEPGIPVTMNEFDRDPMVANVENGILDLRTGTISPHDPAAKLAKLMPVTFREDATCPRWLAFLEEIFEGDEEIIDLVQRMAGYTMTGDVSEEVVFFLHGNGKNGKSTLLNVLLRIMGDYAATSPSGRGLLEQSKQERHPAEIADLCGRRLVTSVETAEGKPLDEQRIKQLASQDDRLRARKMYGNFYEFKPTHHLWVATNHKPVIRGSDEGIWRRIRLIPFEYEIPEKSRVANFDSVLLEEAPGILNWMLAGCRGWLAGGLPKPKKVEDAMKLYREDMDVIGRFLGECCVLGDEATVISSSLRSVYESWCSKNGEYPYSARRLGAKLRKLGLAPDKGSGGVRKWNGVRLKTPRDAKASESSD